MIRFCLVPVVIRGKYQSCLRVVSKGSYNPNLESRIHDKTISRADAVELIASLHHLDVWRGTAQSNGSRILLIHQSHVFDSSGDMQYISGMDPAIFV